MEEKLPNHNLEHETTHEGDAHTPPKKKFTKKLLLILLAFFASMVLLAVVITIFTMRSAQINQENLINDATPQGSILFNPANVALAQSGTQSSDIEISTGGKQITGVLLSIKYNPLLLTNVKIAQVKDETSALSYSLEQEGEIEYDLANGIVLISLELPKDVGSLSGKGKIATLTFTRSNKDIAVDGAQVNFMPNTNFKMFDSPQTDITTNSLVASFMTK